MKTTLTNQITGFRPGSWLLKSLTTLRLWLARCLLGDEVYCECFSLARRRENHERICRRIVLWLQNRPSQERFPEIEVEWNDKVTTPPFEARNHPGCEVRS